MKVITKISISFFSLAVLLTAISGFLIYNSTKDALQKSISANKLEIARGTMAQIDRVMYERFLDIQDISSSMIIEKYILNQASKEDVSKRLDSFFVTSGPWDIIKIVNDQGKIIFSSDQKLVDESINTKKTAKIAYDKSINGEVYVSDLVISEDTGLPTIFFSAPIKKYSIGKDIIGVTIGQFSWPAIQEIVQSGGDDNTDTSLFSENESLLASSNQSLKVFDETVKGHKGDAIPEGEEFSGILKDNNGTYDSLVIQAPQIGFLDYKGHNWELILEQPISIAFDSAAKSSQQIILIYIPVIVTFFLISFFLINGLVVSPLEKITTVTQSIANGDINQRVEINQEDEIGQLGASINKMTDELLNTQATIEKKVIERTSQIENINRHMVNRELKMIELKKQLKK